MKVKINVSISHDLDTIIKKNITKPRTVTHRKVKGLFCVECSLIEQYINIEETWSWILVDWIFLTTHKN